MKTILIIEDDVNIRESLAELLEIKEYQVLSATNGEEGLDSALMYHPDLIICDVMMPVLNGFEVLQSIRNHPFTEDIPFIFLSAQALKTDVENGISSGANDYLIKPFRAQDLFYSVNAILRPAIA